MEFKVLHVSTLNEEVAKNLETCLNNLSGVEQFTITLATKEMDIVFDEAQLSFRSLVKEMTKAGCPLRGIDAALFL